MRSLTSRAVTLVPLLRPASGDVLMPTVIEMAGSSTVMSGSGDRVVEVGKRLADGDLGDPRDGDDVTGARGGAGDPLERLGHQQLGDLDGLLRPVPPQPGDVLTLAHRALVDAAQRQPAEERGGVEVRHVGLERRALDVLRCRDGLDDRAEERLEVGRVGHRAVGRLLERRAAGLGRRVDDREVERVLVVLVVEQVEEQLVRLLDDLGDPRVGTVDLVDDEDDRELLLERLAQHEAGLRQRALGGVDEQHDPVHHGQSALDLAAEVRVPRGVDDVDRHRLGGRRAGVAHGGVLGEDRDPLLALQVAGVHRAHVDVLVVAERAGLPEHGVHERRLAVVDVRHDGDVAQVVSARRDGRGR